MKRKVLMLSVLPLALSAGIVSCKGDDASGGNKAEIALVTDVGNLKDGSFNEGTWNGVEEYAKANNKTYDYYQPKDGDEASRITAMNDAIDNGAKVIVAPGFLQAGTLRKVAPQNKDVKFVFVDGWNVTDKADADGNDIGEVIKNVTAVSYKEHESGYMAGYAAVKEGYTKLAGTFGGGGTNPACNRFAYGYVQGINDAAAGLSGIECKISFKYGSSFSASPELKAQMDGWYTSGTQVVFSCGGGMFSSVLSSANEGDNRKIIGVDVDQKGASEKVITSAVKGLAPSVKKVLGQIYDNKWDSDLGGKGQQLGASDDSTGIAYHADRLTKFTKAAYDELYAKIKAGNVTIKSDGASGEASFWTTVNTELTNVAVTLDA